MKRVAGGALIVVLAAVAYAGAASMGLFADDFQWLVGSSVFDPARLVDLTNRDHFYRPIVEVYFPTALAICGRSASCYHGLSIGLHAFTCLLVAGMVGTISGRKGPGLIAGLLFAVQPGPGEAVLWVSAVSELLVTMFFVLTVWLFWYAQTTNQRGAYVAACVTFVAGLLSHESGVMQLPILVLMLWLLPRETSSNQRSAPWWQRLKPLVPCAIAFAAYLAVSYVINSKNYVVTTGSYGIGLHVVSNVFGALVTFTVARREPISLLLISAFMIWAMVAASPRARFYALWTIVTLLPFAGFRDGLASRYLYLSAVGFAALVAEVLWDLRLQLSRWPRVGVAVWLILAAGLTIRFAAFTVKNIRVSESAGTVYTEYAARVRALYPSLSPGARIEVPQPPPDLPPEYVPALLQWEYRDPTLNPVIVNR